MQLILHPLLFWDGKKGMSESDVRKGKRDVRKRDVHCTEASQTQVLVTNSLIAAHCDETLVVETIPKRDHGIILDSHLLQGHLAGHKHVHPKLQLC